MKLFVTGGAGFIGSNFVHYMLDADPAVEIVNFDALTYAGNLENLAAVEKHPRYTFIKGDISQLADVKTVFEARKFDAIVNFAAESHVDRSLHFGAGEFIETNILGTQILLDAARYYKTPRYLQVSTDEVYGSLGQQGKFTEASPVQPNNPYAATKAGADFMVRAAHKSYGLDTVITRCSNNFGPRQFPEKLIPLMIANALENKPLPVYGDGRHVRDWIYVLDHCQGIDTVLRKGKPGEIYNLGGLHDVPNIDVVRLILKYLNKPESLIQYVKDRPGHDRRYAIDTSKIQGELGWKPRLVFEDALRSTVEWYLANRPWWERIRSGEYQKYYATLYAQR
ncbi:MAG: dTDP-glucose 4,6-dehydratase [Lentisphaerae bacterium]|nr:dTDP-glucose 4,6-dehydratase [Lentisphaerota bacterium]